MVLGLIDNLPDGEAVWDVVTGNGVGALNALIISQHAKGAEKTSLAPALEKFWSDFNRKVIYNNWTLGWLNALLFQSGLYNSAPMKQTIDNLNSGKYERFLAVGTTDLLTGDYVVFNTTKSEKDYISTGVYASA